MKKLIFLVAMLPTLWAQGQVKSVTDIKVTRMIEALSFTHVDSTTGPADKFYTRVEVSTTPLFTFSFFSAKKIRKGTGENNDTITKPLVTAGDTFYLRVWISNDSNFTNPKISGIRIGIPYFVITTATVSFLSFATTTTTIKAIYQWNDGLDTAKAKIKIECALDKDFVLKQIIYGDTFNPVTKPNGTDSLLIVIGNPNKKVFLRITIINSMGSKVDTTSITTLAIGQRPWLRKPADSIPTTGTDAKMCGRAIAYGVKTLLKLGSDTFSIYGTSEENFVFSITGLVPKTQYTKRIYATSVYGSDSMDIVFTTKDVIGKMIIRNDSVIQNINTLQLKGYYASASNVHIEAGLFNDSTCTVAVQSSSKDYSAGAGTISANFPITQIGTYWAKFWGTNSTGEFVFDATPAKIVVTKIITAGVDDILSKSSFSIYPNPANDHITISIPNIKEEKDFEMYDATGRLVYKQTLVNPETQINVRNFAKGLYYTNLGKKIIVQ